MKPPSLLRRLLLAQTLVLAGIYVVVTGWMMYAMLAVGSGDIDRRMLFFGQRLAEAASAGSLDEEALRSRMAAAERVFIDGFAAMDGTPGYEPVYQVWARDAQLLHRTAAAPAVPMAAAPGQFGTHRFGDAWWQSVAAESGDGRVHVHIAERWSDRWFLQWLLVRDIGLIQLLALALTMMAILLAAQRAFAPLRQLAAQLASRAPGDLQRFRIERPYRETGPIVNELNALLTREAERLDRERRLLADVAHELRTPLAAIGTLAHLVITAGDDDSRRHAASKLQEGIDRVSHLLGQLLSQARADATFRSDASSTVDFTVLVQDRLAHHAVAARARGIDLSFDGPRGVELTVDTIAVTSLIDNLVDNAIRYTSNGGRVSVHLEASGSDSLGLIVRDNGPGIPQCERQRVFEAFYRLPGTVQEGSGLGLSIVERAAQACAASVDFVDGLDGRGVGLRVRFKGRSSGIPDLTNAKAMTPSPRGAPLCSGNLVR